MSTEAEERFELSNICWICGELVDVADEKVKDHCHVTGKHRGAAHWNCNVKMSTKIPVICHNIKDYDSHLIIKEVIPNTFSFTINRYLAFTDSMQFMESRLDSLVKYLMD